MENAYYACLKEKAVLFAGVSDENAEAVISAARGACFNQRRAIYDAVPIRGSSLRRPRSTRALS